MREGPSNPGRDTRDIRSGSRPATAAAPRRTAAGERSYQPPAFEWIALDCEITAYAPAGDEPLF